MAQANKIEEHNIDLLITGFLKILITLTNCTQETGFAKGIIMIFFCGPNNLDKFDTIFNAKDVYVSTIERAIKIPKMHMFVQDHLYFRWRAKFHNNNHSKIYKYIFQIKHMSHCFILGMCINTTDKPLSKFWFSDDYNGYGINLHNGSAHTYVYHKCKVPHGFHGTRIGHENKYIPDNMLTIHNGFYIIQMIINTADNYCKFIINDIDFGIAFFFDDKISHSVACAMTSEQQEICLLHCETLNTWDKLLTLRTNESTLLKVPETCCRNKLLRYVSKSTPDEANNDDIYHNTIGYKSFVLFKINCLII